MYFDFDNAMRNFAKDENNTVVEYMVTSPELVLEFQALEIAYDQS